MIPAKEMRAPVAVVNKVLIREKCDGLKTMLLTVMKDCGSLDKAISVTARLLRAVFDRDRELARLEPSAKDLTVAKPVWI